MSLQNYQPRLIRKFGGIVALAVVLASVGLPLAASAASQSYNVLNNKAQPGMLMSLTANSSVVEPASDKNAALLLGVISTNDTAFDVQPGQISVATDGEVSTLVSTLGGDIRVGDRIAPSSLAGIGSKVKTSAWIVGIAQASLDAKTTGAVASTITDTKGGQHKVYVASIPLVVHVTYYTVPAAASRTIPDMLQAAADAIAGKHASVLGLVLSFILLLTGVIWAGILINGAIKGGIAAIARQPLSKAFIRRTVLKTFGVSGLIVIVVCVGALMLLRIL
jgi:hypothetical protein